MAPETYRRALQGEGPYVSYGLSFEKSCERHVRDTFRAQRVYILASESLSRSSDALQRLKSFLGSKVAGERIGLKPHTYWSEVLEVARHVTDVEADLIITLGGGSLTDGAKIVALAVANKATTFADLEKLEASDDWDDNRRDVKPPTLPIICIPTTLSGGEYHHIAGGTNDHTKEKRLFSRPTQAPALVILDPTLTLTTPQSVWLSSGVRAIDHCIEAVSALEASAETDRMATDGLRELVPALLRCKKDRTDVEARHRCQLSVIMAAQSARTAPMGASHGIGHQLGPFGVGHGETSCVLLPAVCRYNLSSNEHRQEKAKRVLLGELEVRELLEGKNVDMSTAELGDILDVIITELGLPRTLSSVGVGAGAFDTIAENSLRDFCCQTNPVPLVRKEQIVDILISVA